MLSLHSIISQANFIMIFAKLLFLGGITTVFSAALPKSDGLFCFLLEQHRLPISVFLSDSTGELVVERIPRKPA
jgi:hypothetical protein